MKFSTSISFLALGILTVAPTLWAKPLKGQISTVGNNTAQTFFIVSIDDKKVVYSGSPTGANSKTIALAKIDSISFIAPEGWESAETSFNEGNFEVASSRFGKLADDYSGIAAYSGSYGARARYFEMESLRQLGKTVELSEAIAKMKKSGLKLDSAYSEQLDLYSAWAAAGKERWQQLETILATYEVPAEDGKDEAEFKELPSAQFVQIAFLRGLLKKGMGKNTSALKDFTRAIVLNFGQEPAVAGQAALAALDILVEDPEANRDEAYALTQVYMTQFGAGNLPDRFKDFAKKPE